MNVNYFAQNKLVQKSWVLRYVDPAWEVKEFWENLAENVRASYCNSEVRDFREPFWGIVPMLRDDGRTLPLPTYSKKCPSLILSSPLPPPQPFRAAPDAETHGKYITLQARTSRPQQRNTRPAKMLTTPPRPPTYFETKRKNKQRRTSGQEK